MTAASPDSGQGERTVRVVVADDNADVRQLIRIALQVTGEIEVVGEAADGQELVDLCLQLQPDGVVTDHVMPVMSGAHALRILRPQLPDAVLVLCTASSAVIERPPEADALVLKASLDWVDRICGALLGGLPAG